MLFIHTSFIHSNKDEISLKKIINNIKELQEQDEFCKAILLKDQNDVIHEEHYQVYREILFHGEKTSENWRIVIPASIKNKIIEQNHCKLGHPGVYKTLVHLERFYFWKSMGRDVKQFVISCDLCQRVKYLSIAMGGSPSVSTIRCTIRSYNGRLFWAPSSRSRGSGLYIRSFRRV